MTFLAWFVVGSVSVWALAAMRVPGMIWAGAAAAALAAWTAFSDVSTATIALTWIIFLLAASIFNLTFLRRKLISDPFLRLFRTMMPHMSKTEREALEAGTVWWDAELFSGRPNWKKLLTIPAPTLTAEEQAFLDGPTDELCHMLDDWCINAELHDLPPEVWQFIKGNGFFGMIIPKKYGGLEFSSLAHSNVVMKVASRSIAAAVTVMVPNSLGPGELLLHYGTEEQKNHYLPRLARGEEVPCFALTSPDAGSDAASMTDIGVVCRGEFRGKKDVVGIRLNWEKRYITLGPVATVLGLAFKLYDPDHLIGDREEIGITVALIPTNLPGISIGRRHTPSNISFQNGPNTGRDVFIPLDWIIGGAARAGQGWRMLMESLAAGRSISLPALATGAGKLASRATGAYARIRKQFHVPIGRFEGIEEVLARIAGYTYLMDAARIMTAGAVDLGEKPSVISAIVKYHLTEIMRRVVNDAMDVQGGSAICMGPRNFLAQVYEAVPISITVEGANILTRSLIIYGQGAIRCHPFILKEIQAAADSDPVQASKNFDRALFDHIGFFLSNAARSLFLGLTGARLATVRVHGPARRYYRQLTRMSCCLALTSDVAMLVLGASLKRRERLSARLGDVLSRLYLASAALKRFEDQGRPLDDLPLLKWGCNSALKMIQQSLDELIRNFPNRPAARLLRFFVFPTGKPYRAPSDALGHKLASLVLEPSSARDRLTAGIYIPADSNEAIGRLEVALEKVIAAEAIEERLRLAARAGRIQAGDEESLLQEGQSSGVIQENEAKVVREAEALRREVITVDDFPADYWTTVRDRCTDAGKRNLKV
jgi:acyl-CoA dehydrogenase